MLKKIAIATILGGLSSVALADGLTVKVGASILDITGKSTLAPGVNNAAASDEINFTPAIEYRFAGTPFSAEVLLATPFKHAVTADGLGEIASVKHLPPTITAKYNLDLSERLTAYVGAGVTVFVPWDEESPLGDLEADVAVGPAAQLGFNYKPDTAGKWGVYVDVRYADLKTDLKLNGAELNSLDLDPLVYSLGYSYNF